MTLTLSLTTSHLTADTESGQHVFSGTLLKLHLTVSRAFTLIFKNKSLASEKHLELHSLLLMLFLYCGPLRRVL